MLNHEFPIAIASRRSGVSQHLIRAWEKRYGAIRPTRSGTQRRLYSDGEIERLQLLRAATEAGHRIGNIATLSTDALRPLAAEMPIPGKASPEPSTTDGILAEALAAVRVLDSSRIEKALQAGLVALGRGLLIHRVISPLIQKIGDEWELGTLRIVHEHCATAVVRTVLGTFIHSHSATANAPVLIITTPPGQHHELGALIVAATAIDRGWSVFYPGPSLPVEEIAAACIQSKADALALSVIYPADDPGLPAQLRAIRQLMPEARIIVGGRAASAYRAVLREINATLCEDLAATIAALEAARLERVR